MFLLKKSFLVATILVAGLSTAVTQPQNPASRVFNEVGIDQNLDAQLPLDIVLRDEEGNDVVLQKYFNARPVVLSFVYYECPMLCNQVLTGMAESFRTLDFTVGKEFEVVTVSIDPRDTPLLASQKKAAYMKMYDREGSEKGWHFLTGDSATVKKLADVAGFKYVYDEKSGQFAHASGIMIATPKGRLARYLYGIEYGGNDLKFSMMEAAVNKIGSPVDKLLLLCYHYDPNTGKYGVVVTNILRGAGALTLLILGGFMFTMFRRDRRLARELAKQGS